MLRVIGDRSGGLARDWSLGFVLNNFVHKWSTDGLFPVTHQPCHVVREHTNCIICLSWFGTNAWLLMNMWLLVANSMGNHVYSIDIWHWLLFIIHFTQESEFIFLMKRTLYIVVMSAEQFKNKINLCVTNTYCTCDIYGPECSITIILKLCVTKCHWKASRHHRYTWWWPCSQMLFI